MWRRAALAALAATALAAAPAVAQDAPQRTAPLKIRKVVLYKHGVGYFEREGQVEGNVTIPLAFKTDQMPDVLKSLYAVHTQGAGRITSIVYDSKDPLSKQLADIMVEVPSGSALTAFLQQLKGAPVEIALGADTVRGNVMGIEPIATRTEAGVTQRYKVVLLGQDGIIRPLELLDASHVRVLDPALQRDLQRMMEIYARARHADRKVVDLQSEGGGPRTLRVGYIIEQPIWKTTYRLLFEPGEKPLLQGWAIVENRTDEDWEDVRLSFVAGSPLSFLMDLYTSYYPQRPEVGVQTADSTGGELFNRNKLAETMERMRDARKARAAPRPAEGFAADEAAKNQADDKADADGPALGRLLAASLGPAATGADAGELFSYNSKGTVHVKRGQAALVPILLESLDGGERILYFRQDLSRFPQHAYLCKNSSTLTLEKGPITVFEGSTCQGESLLQQVLKPGMHAVLPFAIETAVEIDATAVGRHQPVHRATLAHGVLTFHQTMVHEMRYTIREKAGSKRVVIIDHPRTAGAELNQPATAFETLPGHHRFRVECAANGEATLVVRESRAIASEVHVRNASLEQVQAWISQPYLSDGARAVLTAVRGILDERARVAADLQAGATQRRQYEQDHERVRRTLSTFRSGSEERELRDKYLQRLVKLDADIDALDAQISTWQARAQSLDARLAAELDKFEEK